MAEVGTAKLPSGWMDVRDIPEDAIEFPGWFRWDESRGDVHNPPSGVPGPDCTLYYGTRQRRIYLMWSGPYQELFAYAIPIKDVIDLRRVRGNPLTRREGIDIVCSVDGGSTCHRISEKRSQGRIDEVMPKLLSVWKRASPT